MNIRIATNNIWKCDNNQPAWAEMGKSCAFDARCPALIDAYRTIAPDILGLQEVSYRMENMLDDQMHNFAMGEGIIGHYELVTGGDTPIFFRSDKFTSIESGFFRYSTEVPGYEGSFNNSGTKSYCWVVLKEKTSGKYLAVMSTHLWWKSSKAQEGSDVARAYQIEIALKELERIAQKYQCPAICMGDFNASMTSLCLDKVRELGWSEVHDVAEVVKNECRGHHPCGNNGYSRPDDGTFSQAIDHMVVKFMGDCKVKSFDRLMDAWYDPISDHYPAFFDMEF